MVDNVLFWLLGISACIWYLVITAQRQYIHWEFDTEYTSPSYPLPRLLPRKNTQITTILLHWKRTNSLIRIFHNLQNANVSRNFIIWNNNPDIVLQEKLFGIINVVEIGKTAHRIEVELRDGNNLRIINNGHNIRDHAKYIACGLALDPYCYYQDDDWDTSRLVRPLYHAHLAQPDKLHTVTDSYTLATNLRWSFHSSSIGLHTTAAWIGVASIFPRKLAIDFLQVFDRLSADERGYADMFFALWSNTEPAQYSFAISQFDASHGFGSQDDFLEKQYQYQVNAIRTLDYELKKPEPKSFFIGTGATRTPQVSHALCYTGDCVFMRTPTLFRAEDYDISRDYARGTRDNLPDSIEAEEAKMHQEEYAVDQDVFTCWTSLNDIASNDYYGLRSFAGFIRDQLHVVFKHPKSIQARLIPEISFNNLEWVLLTHHRAIYEVMFNHELHYLASYSFHLEEADSDKISLRFRYDGNLTLRFPFQICHIGVLPLIYSPKWLNTVGDHGPL